MNCWEGKWCCVGICANSGTLLNHNKSSRTVFAGIQQWYFPTFYFPSHWFIYMVNARKHTHTKCAFTASAACFWLEPRQPVPCGHCRSPSGAAHPRWSPSPSCTTPPGDPRKHRQPIDNTPTKHTTYWIDVYCNIAILPTRVPVLE